jgi:hypothetical protein
MRRCVRPNHKSPKYQTMAGKCAPRVCSSGLNVPPPPAASGAVALAVPAVESKTACMRTCRRPCRASAARSPCAGLRFPPDVIVVAVRWYLRFGLSYRDVEELLIERGVEVDHVTVYRWVLRFTPLLAEAARPCRDAVGARWRVDETYVKVAGHWRYVYRAIDQFGQVIGVSVARRRNADAARGSSSGPAA